MFQRTRALLKRFTASGDERRAHARHEVDVETTCHFLADGTEFRAHIRNVSRSGLKLFVPHEVPEGTMVRVQLPGPADGLHTTVLACVTNTRELPENQWSLGCVFSLEMSDAEMRLLGGENQPASPEDQRAWVRFPTQGTVEYRQLPGDDGSSRTADLVDLSPGGLGLIVADPLEPGDAITVNLRRQNKQADRSMLACVVYMAERPDGKRAVGCNFLHELSERELKELVGGPGG